MKERKLQELHEVKRSWCNSGTTGGSLELKQVVGGCLCIWSCMQKGGEMEGVED